MLKKLFFLLITVMLVAPVLCYALPGDIYEDGFFRTTSTGVQRPITLTTGGNMPIVEVFTTGDTLTAAETGKLCIVRDTAGGGDFNFTLPAATAGLNYQFTLAAGSTISVIPNGTDFIEYGTTTMKAGDILRSPGATNDSITLVCGTAGYWAVTNINGTWTDDTL